MTMKLPAGARALAIVAAVVLVLAGLGCVIATQGALART